MAVYYWSAPVIGRVAYGFLSNLSRLLFTLAETDNGLEIDLVGEGEDNLEPSFIVLGFLAIFLESDDDLGLYHQPRTGQHGDGGELTLPDSAPGSLTEVYKFFLDIVSHIIIQVEGTYCKSKAEASRDFLMSPPAAAQAWL
jgi:hypothetical protein